MVLMHNEKPVQPARSLFHSLLIKARPENELAELNKVDPASGLVEIPGIVWAEFAALVETGTTFKRIS